jgi:hypothetical protein
MIFWRKLKLIGIIFTVFFITISINHYWDMRHAQDVLSIRIEEKNIPEYEINVEFIEETMTLNSSQKLSYTNSHNQILKHIYFHLYPNQFKTKEATPFAKGEVDKAYPNGFDPGFIKIKTIKVNNKETDYKIMGASSTILRVTPIDPLKPGEKIDLLIDFQLKLPNALGRMGYGENTVNITNWFPILAVYDDNGWNLDPYYSIGDPFYSQISKYDITVTIPEEYVIASTGDILNVNKRRNKFTYEIQGNYVRNFAMILSKKFEVKEALADNIRIASYSIEGTKGEAALQYGVDSIQIFNALFGKYPYKQLSIVASDFYIGGMEYPNLIMIGKQLYEMEEDFLLEYIIAHETAHQWWYGIVGNNEVKEPWLDEALTEYSTLLYFEKKYGPQIKEKIFEKLVKSQYENYIRIHPNSEGKILRELKEFESSWEYSSVVYSGGAVFIEKLRSIMGDENFFNCLREYYESYQFKNATTQDFYIICQKNTKKELKDTFNYWLNGNLE